jgi:hypothetical protein
VKFVCNHKKMPVLSSDDMFDSTLRRTGLPIGMCFETRDDAHPRIFPPGK